MKHVYGVVYYMEVRCGTTRYVSCGYLLVCCSNFVHRTHRFWDIRLQKWRDLKNREGHWKCHHSI